MPFLRRLFRFSSRSRGDIARDVRDEIAFHLEMRARELMQRGWSREPAFREAERQFGDLEGTAAYCRRLDLEKERSMRIHHYLGELWQDLTYGARLLYRHPGHSVVALLTIAIGIGATTLVFSVVHAALLAPLPYAHAERLMVVRLSLPDHADVRESTDAFEDSGVFASNQYVLDDEQVLGGVVSAGFFRTLGVNAAIGRTFLESDSASPIVVLGHSLWQRRFGADPNVIGRTIVLSGNAHTVVGVMPPRFQFPSRAFQLWANMGFTMTLVPQQTRNRGLRIFQMVGRLRPDVTMLQAQAQFTALADRLASAYPDTNQGMTLTLVPILDRLVGDARLALLIALGAVGCLLFIACANVASLNLARITMRTHELAVRAAIGAGRWRIARQLFAESLFMSACGGAFGLILAYWGVTALPALVGNRVPRVEEATLSVPVLALSAAIVVLCGLLVASVPVLQLSISGLEPALKGGPRGGESPFGIRLRSALVVVQIGLAVVVLSGALVLTRSLVRLVQVNPGFAPDRLLTFHLLLINQPTPAARAAMAARALDAIASVPGVAGVGGATGLAPVTAQRATTFEVDGRTDVPLEERRGYFIATAPNHFTALSTPVLSGREFSPADTDRAEPVVAISKSLAERFFPDGSAVGRRLRLVNPEQSDSWRTIVGVVDDVRYQGLDDGDPPVVYTPFAQTPFPWIYVYVRAKGDPLALVEPLRRTVKSVDPQLVAASPQPMAELIANSSADPRFRTTLVALFAGAGVLLAAVGLHGLIAFAVARRAREIAIRLALGASASSVRWRVVKQSLLLAGTGLTLGLAAAFWTKRFLADLLYEVSPGDPVSHALAAALLLAVAVIASAVPARRATRIQPVEALRDA